ncbi:MULTISPECIES: hypothetical protein [Comamonas]|uniref:Uncharacterized protein n=1 Tax=Comamonas thiooxydans TaxID=363952 RepID=A0A096FVJ6_9BURK|nr:MULTISPECIES: hypothetical protein [Comamonas]KGG81872.1 hypothetical protein P609_22865 [Comamonas thiooxydans]KGG93650.1 hypothetical protein P369_08135 [Comamonas thiooxydans]KGG98894.1 hypothetical protein P367_11110 [Comamonas thiooxydans]KGH05218.1 hypothetical protein P365_11190 [Comamonas thiooxydans]KGH14348.1 hypothetical protein P368_06750 [Comamonas thiooxydans]
MSDTPQTETSKPAAPAKNRLVVWLIALPVIIFGALMLIGQFMDDPLSKQRWTEAETIKICWKQTAKPEAERKTQEFKAPQDCERLEFDFKTRYGENP